MSKLTNNRVRMSMADQSWKFCPTTTVWGRGPFTTAERCGRPFKCSLNIWLNPLSWSTAYVFDWCRLLLQVFEVSEVNIPSQNTLFTPEDGDLPKSYMVERTLMNLQCLCFVLDTKTKSITIYKCAFVQNHRLIIIQCRSANQLLPIRLPNLYPWISFEIIKMYHNACMK